MKKVQCPICGNISSEKQCQNCGWDFTKDILNYPAAAKAEEGQRKAFADDLFYRRAAYGVKALEKRSQSDNPKLPAPDMSHEQKDVPETKRSNPESAKLSGINVNKFVYVLYMMIGFFAAVAGILSISRYGSAPASLGQGVEFRVISALLIGGVSLNGGEGSILGTFLGILLMALISNALTLFAIDTNLQNVLIGAIMVISVAIDEANRRRQK